MKNYLIMFKGRKRGAIGLRYYMNRNIKAQNDFDFINKLYMDYEHIGEVRLFIDGEKANFWDIQSAVMSAEIE